LILGFKGRSIQFADHVCGDLLELMKIGGFSDGGGFDVKGRYSLSLG